MNINIKFSLYYAVAYLIGEVIGNIYENQELMGE